MNLKVMVSATAFEFAYTQAPPSMKAVAQSFELLTTCIGNIIDIFLVQIKLGDTQAGFHVSHLYIYLIGQKLER